MIFIVKQFVFIKKSTIENSMVIIINFYKTYRNRQSPSVAPHSTHDAYKKQKKLSNYGLERR